MPQYLLLSRSDRLTQPTLTGRRAAKSTDGRHVPEGQNDK